MSKPELIREEQNLFEEISNTIENFEIENDNPSENLRAISNAIIENCKESSNESILAKEILNRYQMNRELIPSNYLRRYINIINFSILTNCTWMVLK